MANSAAIHRSRILYRNQIRNKSKFYVMRIILLSRIFGELLLLHVSCLPTEEKKKN